MNTPSAPPPNSPRRLRNARLRSRGAVAALVAGVAVALFGVSPLFAETPERVESVGAFAFETQQGRWHTTQRTTLTVVYDRGAEALRIEHPGATVVVRDGTLRATIPDLPGHAIETAMPELRYDALLTAVPPLATPEMVNLAMLLADDPADALAGGAGAFSTPADAPDTRRLETMAGAWEIELAPSGLAAAARFDMKAGQMGPQPAVFTYRYTLETGDAAGDGASFTLDTSDLQTSSSFQEMIQAVQAAAAGGNAGGAAGAREAEPGAELVGRDAPDFTLDRLGGGGAVTLSELGDRVVVLDFWATWCPPCVKGLPEVQAVHDWAEAEGKPVDVFAVNLREDAGPVERFLEKHDLELPVLMDVRGRASEAYGVQAIPTTVVIARGKVAAVHVGFTPDLRSELKADIDRALAAP